ncbi:MAG: BMP family ABC transporter substrate-binding protein [Polyangiaceae bacterium]|nr:BMP family ABC transporter substrate-binding protein [Polyangiaceae bacterium]
MVVKRAVGDKCNEDSECQGLDSTCHNGLCTHACADDKGCPKPTKCFFSKCQEELTVAGIWVGLAHRSEGWTIAHHEGIVDANRRLGYLKYEYAEEVLSTSENADDIVEEFINPADPLKKGAQVIIANSSDHTAQVTKWAARYPNTTFIQYSGRANGTNVGSYSGRMEHAWYIAGRIAARKSNTKHLGYIGSFVTAEVVRYINAFTLGARSEDPAVIVEARWVGFWYDVGFDRREWKYEPLHMGTKSAVQNLTAEEYLTAKLIDSGADVITHNMDNQRVSKYIHKHTKDGTLRNSRNIRSDQPFDVWSIAVDNEKGYLDENGVAYSNTIGAVYWNWGPAYADMLELVHRGAFEGKAYIYPLTSDSATSVVGFSLSPAYDQVSSLDLRRMINK